MQAAKYKRYIEAHSKGICYNQLEETQKHCSLEHMYVSLPSAMTTVSLHQLLRCGVVNSGLSTRHSISNRRCGFKLHFNTRPYILTLVRAKA